MNKLELQIALHNKYIESEKESLKVNTTTRINSIEATKLSNRALHIISNMQDIIDQLLENKQK